MIDWQEIEQEWSNTGWNDIWIDFVNNQLKPNSKDIDKLEVYTKEKFGQLRVDIFPSIYNEDEDTKLEWKSEWTCMKCGKQPKNSKGEHIIWLSKGWISPYCKECAKKIENYNKNWKRRFTKCALKHNLLSYKRFSQEGTETHNFEWKDNDIIEL